MRDGAAGTCPAGGKVMDPRWYARVIESCFPGLSVGAIRFLGGGSSRVFLVNDELVFRYPHGPGLDDDLRLPLPVPRCTHFTEGCAEFRHPVAGRRQIRGICLEHLQVTQPVSLAAQLGGFLSALHGLPLPAGAEARRSSSRTAASACAGRWRGNRSSATGRQPPPPPPAGGPWVMGGRCGVPAPQTPITHHPVPWPETCSGRILTITRCSSGRR